MTLDCYTFAPILKMPYATNWVRKLACGGKKDTAGGSLSLRHAIWITIVLNPMAARHPFV
jgi:hypothetical protein